MQKIAHNTEGQQQHVPHLQRPDPPSPPHRLFCHHLGHVAAGFEQQKVIASLLIFAVQ